MNSSSCVLRSLWMTFFDSSLFGLDVVSDRFDVLLRRYHLFVRDIPGKFQHWLNTAPAQKRVFSTLEAVCTDLFPDMMSIASADFPQRWMLSVACVALKHHVSTLRNVELSECGKGLRVLVDDGDPPLKCKKEADKLDNTVLRASLQDSICAAGRAAALEVKVAELGCRSKGWLSSSIPDDKPCRKRKQPLPDPVVENVFAYLSECRAEALDALVALRKTHRSARRHSEKLSAAHAEIGRLRGELERLQKQKAETQPPAPVSTVLPKRVLSLAGFWNLAPNDLLSVTPALVQSVEQRGGAVVRRDGVQVCFEAHGRDLLIEAAVATMAEHLPQYKRRTEF